MKLSLTLHNKTYSVESSEEFDDASANELAEQFKGLLVNAGFHPSNVDALLNTEYQWFSEEERNDNMQGHLLNKDRFSEGYLKGLDDAMEKKRLEEFQDNLYKQNDEPTALK